MLALFRSRLVVAAIGCLAADAAPIAAQVRTQQPGPDTPRILIATFRSSNSEPTVGIESSEALRARVQQSFSPRDAWVIPRATINASLKASGYPEDAVLSPADLKMLAQQLRADVIVDGSVAKTAVGLAMTARLVMPSNIDLVQPLPSVEGRNAGDAAKAMERHFEAAQKSVPDFKRCSSALSAQKYDEARRAAQQTIARYPASTLGRLCLLDALSRAKEPIDSVIGAAQAVLTIDSTSVLALTNLVDAYREKHDTANTVTTLQKLVVYRPDLRPELARVLAQMNQPKLALPIIKQQLTENPGDPVLLRMQWLMLLADHQWKAARQAGETYVKEDTAAANVDYFTRSIAAALADSQPAVAADVATSGVTKFPKSAPLWALAASAQRKAGKLGAAILSIRQALALDSKTENGWPFLVAAQLEQGQLDSALASGRAGVAAGADRAAIAQPLNATLAAATNRAQAEKTRERWLEVYRVGSIVDTIASSPNTKFFIAIGALQVGSDALRVADSLKSCTEIRLAEEMWTTATINAPAAAQAGPQQKEAAAQIMTVTQQFLPAIAQRKKSYCKGK
jgi:tetratricopeptide (TPR) repeat protein